MFAVSSRILQKTRIFATASDAAWAFMHQQQQMQLLFELWATAMTYAAVLKLRRFLREAL